MYSIGIVGNGFVGSSVAFGFSPQTGCDADVKIYDKQESKSTHSLEEVLSSEFIFLSVPTPSKPDGSVSLKIVYDIFDEINEVNTRLDNVILLRSTVTPGTTRKIKEKYPLLNIVFNPEFLTERSAKFDFINQSRFVLGGSMGYTERVADLYRWRFGTSIPVLETTYETAELIKYMNNTFFATKVSFMNEMRQVSDKIGANWDEAVDGFVLDGRVGHSHLNVPGPDGKFGFGGSCFPKDIQAMIHFMASIDLYSHVLTGAWNTNLEVRPEEDWKELKGRAVTDE